MLRLLRLIPEHFQEAASAPGKSARHEAQHVEHNYDDRTPS
jgi:hypothetical protein